MNEKKLEALRKYHQALSRLIEAINLPQSPLQPDAVIQRFEFTFELLWKALKIYLEDMGIETKSPKETLKAAFKQGWIADEILVLDMLQDRNRTSHLYDETESNYIFDRIQRSYLVLLKTMLTQLQNKVQ